MTMTIIAILVGILIGTFAVLTVADRLMGPGRLSSGLRGRVSLALVFLFTGIGHFIQTQEMAQMLPAWIPARVGIIYVTGLFEWAGAAGLLVPWLSRAAGVCLIVFLVLVFPANIHAALTRVELGGHGIGSAYLLVRGPLQLLLIWWAYWFAVRKARMVR
jgi:uncharacterized membrane protein